MPAKVESRLITGDKEYDREQMRILLIKNGLTPTEVARALGIAPQSVSQVIHRITNSQRVTTFLENLPIQV